jgi:aspartate aminotransferase
LLSKEGLTEICDAILAENHRREETGDRPLFLLYDQVYWQLTYGQKHFTPVGLRPEMARYTLLIDAVSKAFAGTGLRVGWAVVPPWIRDRMKPLIGHMGAWAGRAEQLATARFLCDPPALQAFLGDFRDALQQRLNTIRNTLLDLKTQGFPVDALDAQGAIYLSAHFDLIGRRLRDGTLIESDEDIRAFLLHKAGIGIVPFSAFGYPENSGWVRFSVGSVSTQALQQAMQRLRQALTHVE